MSRAARVYQWPAVVRKVYPLDVIWRAVARYAEHGGAVYAAAISYYVLFSLFPLLIFAVAALGVLVRDPTIEDRVVGVIVAQFPPEVNLRAQIEGIVAGTSGSYGTVLGVAGLAASVWTASGAFGALRRALNRAFDVPSAQSFIRGKSTDLLSVVGVMLLIGLSIAATAVLGWFRAVAGIGGSSMVSNMVWAMSYFAVSFGLSFLTFLLAYRLIPYLRISLSSLWIGALLASTGFELAKAGFGLYLTNIGQSQQVYGALGGAILFLLFVFVVASIAIFSAEVTAEIVEDRRLRRHVTRRTP